MKAIKGYCVLTNTISGQELVWSVEEPDNGGIYPEVFLSEQEARTSMLDDLYVYIRQYKEGKRQWDEIIWPADEYEVCTIEIDENSNIVVWNDSGDEVIVTTLDNWRKQR
jgi:hypothetical protein